MPTGLAIEQRLTPLVTCNTSLNPDFQSMKAAATARENFADPTKGGAVPAGREGAPVVLFDCTKKEAYTPSKGYKQLFRRLRATFQPKPLKEAISSEALAEAQILVFGCPRDKFTTGEFDALEEFVSNGGSILWMVSEGGEPKVGRGGAASSTPKLDPGLESAPVSKVQPNEDNTRFQLEPGFF